MTHLQDDEGERGGRRREIEHAPGPRQRQVEGRGFTVRVPADFPCAPAHTKHRGWCAAALGRQNLNCGMWFRGARAGSIRAGHRGARRGRCVILCAFCILRGDCGNFVSKAAQRATIRGDSGHFVWPQGKVIRLPLADGERQCKERSELAARQRAAAFGRAGERALRRLCAQLYIALSSHFLYRIVPPFSLSARWHSISAALKSSAVCFCSGGGAAGVEQPAAGCGGAAGCGFWDGDEAGSGQPVPLPAG